MGISLNTPTKSAAPPSIKLQNQGDEATFAVVDIKLDLPMTVFGTSDPKLNGNGNQMTQHALAVMIVDPGQAVTKNGENYDPVAAGDLHTIYISSYAKWDPDRDSITAPYGSWGAVTDNFDMEVGDVGKWKFIAELAPSRAGNNKRRDRKFQLRKAKPEEAAQVRRCEELHAENAQRIALDGQAGNDPFPAGDHGVSEDEF